MIYPLIPNRTYTMGQLRATEDALLKKRQADQVYSAKLRTQKGQELQWAKSRNEEAYSILLFANHSGLKDDATFKFDPTSAADFEINFDGSTLKLQCTMAYEKQQGRESGGKRHIRQMSEYNSLVLNGERVEPIVFDATEVLDSWRTGIADALAAKLLKPQYVGQDLSLLIFARYCRSRNIDTPFREAVKPAVRLVGSHRWQKVFKRVLIVDEGFEAFAEF